MAELDAIPLQHLPLGRLLGIDYGEKRIGVAVSDPLQTIASPLVTLFRRGPSLPIDEIITLVQEQAAVALIVGLPLHMDGRPGEKAEAALAYARSLAAAATVPVFTLDERWTTTSAHKSLIERGRHPSKERDRVDQIAAAFLVQAFLDRLAFCRRHPPES
ncbi:MAG TPA: Holliday junction resolvase RuvX [bacterium]|nr:Holliday junction resolvase RuvX [bacterium]HPR88571.1 Holliday junction resolvase RuvX [bacterium]